MSALWKGWAMIDADGRLWHRDFIGRTKSEVIGKYDEACRVAENGMSYRKRVQRGEALMTRVELHAVSK